eukprot:CAMPEP_0194278938 /NCGR_PEP_ID=MMETSP0169-20130528/12758_1 /TAXON_ID=218684 /ORGANISM="Corethron pennatum, Strain L29A3" /LENGTH=766 /DNA_ID=CAMNT_0039023257 /DNA_START=47 /DNA_END=2347 /DNA_ORIENTATION=+
MGGQISVPEEGSSNLDVSEVYEYQERNRVSYDNNNLTNEDIRTGVELGTSPSAASSTSDYTREIGNLKRELCTTRSSEDRASLGSGLGCCLTIGPGFGYSFSAQDSNKNTSNEVSTNSSPICLTGESKAPVTISPGLADILTKPENIVGTEDDRQSEDTTLRNVPSNLKRELSETSAPMISPRIVPSNMNSLGMISPGSATPIHRAICSRDPVIIEKEFISCRPVDLLKVDEKCLTPLNLACSLNSQSELIEALILINPKAAKSSDQYGTMPLHMACRYTNSEEVLRLLVSVFPDALLAKDDYGNTPLNISIKRNLPPNVIKYILEAKPQATVIPDEDGSFPLHSLRKSGHFFNLTKRLMMTAPEALMVQNRFGCTPLHIAVEANVPLNVLSLMVRVYPQAVMLKDSRGFTPITVAWTMINKMMKISTRSGTIEEREIVKHSLTAMLSGVGMDDDLKKKMNKSWEKMKLLIKAHHYETVNAKIDEVRFRAVHAGSVCCAPPQWIMFVIWMDSENGTDKEIDELGKTPLHYAASAPIFVYQKMPPGQMTTIEYLMRQFPESSLKRDNFDRLPLHWALATGKTWNSGIRSLASTHGPSLLNMVDPQTGLYPFMMASLGDIESDENEREMRLITAAQNKFMWKETAWDLLTQKEKKVHLKRVQAEQDHKHFNTAFELLRLCPTVVAAGLRKTRKSTTFKYKEARDDKQISNVEMHNGNSTGGPNCDTVAVRTAVMAKLSRLRKVASIKRNTQETIHSPDKTQLEPSSAD